MVAPSGEKAPKTDGGLGAPLGGEEARGGGQKWEGDKRRPPSGQGSGADEKGRYKRGGRLISVEFDDLRLPLAPHFHGFASSSSLKTRWRTLACALRRIAQRDIAFLVPRQKRHRIAYLSDSGPHSLRPLSADAPPARTIRIATGSMAWKHGRTALPREARCTPQNHRFSPYSHVLAILTAHLPRAA